MEAGPDGRPPRLVAGPASPGFATIRKRLVDAGEFELADVDGGIEISIQTRPEKDCRRLHFPSGRSRIASMMPGTSAPRMRELPMASGMRKWLALSMQRSPTAPCARPSCGTRQVVNTTFGILSGMAWTVETLNQTVDAELSELPTDMRARLVRISELIESVGLPNMKEPHVRHLRDPLWRDYSGSATRKDVNP